MAAKINRKLQTEPAKGAAAVTPNDSTDLTYQTRGLYVGVSGDVVVTMVDQADGANVTFTGLAGGVVHPLEVKRVWNTNTTATNIVALW